MTKKNKLFGITIPVWLNHNRAVISVLLLIVVALFVSNPTAFSAIENFWEGLTPSTDDNDTETNTTTTTTVDETRYTIRAQWDFIAILDVDGPEWIDVQIYSYPDIVYSDATTLIEENVWHYTVNHATIDFALGEYVYLFIADANGWFFNFQSDRPTHEYYLLEVGIDLATDLYPTDTNQDWGNIWVEWIAA